MKPSNPLNPAAQAAVAALVLLGLLGGSLILAHGGFATSPKRGGTSIFVPMPEAGLLAATLYGMSCIGLLALLRHWRASWRVQVVAWGGYVGVAVGLVALL
jgi:hypothetical protein